ncbi:hypothetical protein [Neobacillus kokaensis]|uniref:Uncharacterized protein n=1 Tax=Neobacillus kokaensis TaxID=2759023 RepID=A0ABQ3MYJ9_9BACI|nr:hypothetical protein [Neobacillus kokaensis]GHH97745.1 hypothetical protein AM1BK_12880 [Neobacillus kokaensis]
MKFFSFKKKKPEKADNINSLLLTKLDRLIELLEKQQKDTDGKNIHLEHVQIDHLENIVFRLDNIEIDQLSGKLLIGTNISASEEFAESLIQKGDKESLKKEAMSEEPSDESSTEPKITKTSKGYRYRN